MNSNRSKISRNSRKTNSQNSNQNITAAEVVVGAEGVAVAGTDTTSS